MSVTLGDIDGSNWQACIDMKDQPHVASNVFSMAQSKVNPRLRPDGVGGATAPNVASCHSTGLAVHCT